MIGLETAGDDAIYDWDVERDAEAFERVQVFPNQVFESISAKEMHAGVTAALDRLQPDAVAIISYSFPDARACLEWCRKHRRIAVLMSATKADDAPRTGWRERVKETLVAQYDAALVGGTPQRAYLKQLGFPNELIFQPYNAVDNDFFWEGAEAARLNRQPLGHEVNTRSETPYFLASNRFVPRKNILRLLEAYAAYRSKVSRPWPLLLVGDGPERQSIEQYIDEHRVPGVVLCGFRQIGELPAYYGLAGAFVHPSLMDQWALVVNEAMAAGLPVLVSDRAGCAQDLVHDGENGYTFDPDDVEGLARLLVWVSAPETNRAALGDCSRKIVHGWAPEAFASGLWNAVEAGRTRALRPFSARGRGILTALRLFAGDSAAFHSVGD